MPLRAQPSPPGPEEQQRFSNRRARRSPSFSTMSSATRPTLSRQCGRLPLRPGGRLWTALSTAYAPPWRRGCRRRRVSRPVAPAGPASYPVSGAGDCRIFSPIGPNQGAWKAVQLRLTWKPNGRVSPTAASSTPTNTHPQAQSGRSLTFALLLVDPDQPHGRNQRELNWICRWAALLRPTASCRANGRRTTRVPMALI